MPPKPNKGTRVQDTSGTVIATLNELRLTEQVTVVSSPP